AVVVGGAVPLAVAGRRRAGGGFEGAGGRGDRTVGRGLAVGLGTAEQGMLGWFGRAHEEGPSIPPTLSRSWSRASVPTRATTVVRSRNPVALRSTRC